MSSTRKHFSHATKIQAIQQLLDGVPIRQVASELGISVRLLRAWRLALAKQALVQEIKAGWKLNQSDCAAVESLLTLSVAQRGMVSQVIQAFAAVHAINNDMLNAAAGPD